MGVLLDIAEIAGLLFVAYMGGWLVGYLAHRLTARAPATSTMVAPQPVATPAPGTDALVKAPVVVPVTNAPPPQVLAAAAALEPVKATAVPDAGEAPPAAPPPPTAPAVSGIDRLKSLSTSIPLVPVAAVPPAAVAAPAPSEPTAPLAPPPAAPAASIAPTAGAATPEPPVHTEPAPVPMHAAAEAIAETPASPPPVAAEVTAQPQPEQRSQPVIPPETAERIEAAFTAAVPDTRGAPVAEPAEAAAVAEPARPEPAPPVPEPAAPPVPAMPASAPGMPWAGALNGQAAQKFAPEPVPLEQPGDEIAEPDAALDVALLSSLADELKVAAPAASAIEPTATAEIASAAELHASATAAVIEPPAPEPVSPTVVPEPAAPPPSPPPAAPRRPSLDEDAAMRAIEGGWSRRDVRALSDAPELADVNAAVSAAQVAVEQVLARNGVDPAEPETRTQASFGKPAGLSQPRDGRRDNLRRIEGLGPLDEVTLNNLGIYHFEQIAGWDQREVLWLENHAFAVGRIAREDWQEQARELIAERDATRALR